MVDKVKDNVKGCIISQSEHELKNTNAKKIVFVPSLKDIFCVLSPQHTQQVIYQFQLYDGME